MIKAIRFAATCGALALATSVSAADPYPTKPVKVVVPWPAGQVTDAATRAVTEVAEKGTPADMAKLLDAERTRIGALNRAANIKAD